VFSVIDVPCRDDLGTLSQVTELVTVLDYACLGELYNDDVSCSDEIRTCTLTPPVKGTQTLHYPLSFTSSLREKPLRSEYISVFLESEIQPLWNFGTNLTNLFIRLYHDYPFHSLPRCQHLHPDSTDS
jgi:hypothetical protein